MNKSPTSKWNWPHERTEEANKNKPRNCIMNDGMSGRPMAILFPFTIGDYVINTPEQWNWFRSHWDNLQSGPTAIVAALRELPADVLAQVVRELCEEMEIPY